MMDQVIHVTSTGSTNDDLMELVRTRRSELSDGTTLWADFQTAGRGQLGNHWWSDKDVNLLFSTVFFPDIPVSQQFLLTEISALAVFDALSNTGVQHLSVKWPNDIYIGEKKVCGIRNETMLSGGVVDVFVTGIGINVNQRRLDFEAPNPTSLINELNHPVDRPSLFEDLRKRLVVRYNQLLTDDTHALQADYFTHLFRREGVHRFRETESGVSFDASVVGVKSDGHLQLQLTDGTVREYAFKQVANVFQNGKTLE